MDRAAEMLIGGRCRHPAPGGADQKPGLDEERFVDVLQGILFFADHRRQGIDADGSALELVDQGQQDAPVHLIEPKAVHRKNIERVVGHRPGNPLVANVGAGDRLDFGTYQFATSESLQEFHIANPAVGIKRLQISGQEIIRDPVSNAYLENKTVNLTSQLTGNGSPTNSVTVLIRGEPGSYQLTATADGDDGGTYSAPFQLVLGQPAKPIRKLRAAERQNVHRQLAELTRKASKYPR